MSSLVRARRRRVSWSAPTTLTNSEDRLVPRSPRRAAGLWIVVGIAVAGVGSIGSAGFNPSGSVQLGRFLSAAVQPELASGFLAVAFQSLVVTVAYAVVATVIAGFVGVAGGAVCCATTWSSPVLGARRTGVPGWVRLLRVGLSVLRNIHEAVWVVVLVAILGRDPFVAVLALAVPFGAITAKVVADAIDTAPRLAFDAVRAAGGSRTSALAFGIAPSIAADLGAYWTYRFECAIRSSAILGTIGAGGIGFQLALSFQALRYAEIWTLIYLLIAASVGIESLSARFRRTKSSAAARPLRRGLVGGIALAFVASWALLSLDLSTLWAQRTRVQAVRFAGELWPPRLPEGGWGRLAGASLQTAQLSIMAIVVAVVIAAVVGSAAARVDGARRWSSVRVGASRMVLVGLRTVPLPVWAIVILFVVRPGPVPGALALGLYTGGVLGRLFADVLETSDSSVYRGLRALGVPSVSAHAYSTVPQLTPRFVALSAYRWGVVSRDAVVVGVVGAGGLGRLLAEQSATFAEGAMATSVLGLLAVSVSIDAASTLIRRAFS